MPQVNVLLNGRAYTVACGQGEEDHVRELGQMLDKRIQHLVSSIGHVGDARLLMMAALMVCDELLELEVRLKEREKDIAALRAQASVEGIQESENRMSRLLEASAARLEAIAAKVARV